MAGLRNEEVLKLYKERPRKKEIETGIRHQNRLKFHTETCISKEALRANPYYSDFIRWIASEEPELLPKDKIERFKQLITVPIPTIELTESIFSHLGNVFRGQDAFNRYEFEDEDKLYDWQTFADTDFWRTHGFQAMISGIDSVWVLDMPREQTTDNPEPQDRLIDITSVVDILVDINNVCQHLIFEISGKVYEYDTEYIRVYPVKDGEIRLPEVEIAHGLGYCPARMFWTDLLMTSNYINKKAPLTNVLGDLDWLLVCHVFKKYMEIGNSYPILATYHQRDNFEGSKTEENRGRSEEEKRPTGADLMGAGSHIEVQMPLPGEIDPMANPVKFINPDVNTLEYHVRNIVDKRDTIFYSVVGKDGEATKEAVNEKQVMASFESQTAILLRIARNFKLIQEFAERCKADVRYGKDVLKEISIDYGTKFFLKSAGDLIEDLKTAKDNGSHSSVVASIMDEIIEAKYRNDQHGLTRAQIMQDLDPLPDKTFDEAVIILEKGGISKEQFIIKVNLLSFVKRFERENKVSITEYASAVDYARKIEGIQEEFERYAEEINGEKKEQNEIVKPELEETEGQEVLINNEVDE